MGVRPKKLKLKVVEMITVQLGQYLTQRTCAKNLNFSWNYDEIFSVQTLGLHRLKKCKNILLWWFDCVRNKCLLFTTLFYFLNPRDPKTYTILQSTVHWKSWKGFITLAKLALLVITETPLGWFDQLGNIANSGIGNTGNISNI